MERLGVLVLIIASLQGLALANVEVTPSQAIVSVGENVTMLCRVSVPIQYCRIVVPGLSVLNLGPQRVGSGKASYYGEGFDKGHCGVSISRVEDANNGLFTCYIGTHSDYLEAVGNMTVVVARAPKMPPILELTRPRDSQGSYKEGERFLATCTVPEGRPVANITWYIGDEMVTDGLTRPDIFPNPKENLYSIRQNLTHETRWTDNTKELRCVATHPILAMDEQRNQAQKRISVNFAPKPANGVIEQFGFTEGSEGTITVRVMANPKPSFLWTVGRENIDEGSSDSTGHYEVALSAPAAPGEYETKLRIAFVTKADVERQYKLQATNTIGQQDYTVTISTSSQPRAMAEMGAGAIVGIVIAVLLVLLIIFVLIFARATGRWCFAAGGGRGKSSQTSSVAHIDPEGHSEKAKHAGVGGNENPSINHNVSSEYINGNDIKKEIKEDTPV